MVVAFNCALCDVAAQEEVIDLHASFERELQQIVGKIRVNVRWIRG